MSRDVQAIQHSEARRAPQTIAVADVVFREDLYPRIKTSHETVQKYAEDVSVLPPIEINQRYELIDGWHRWTAHRKNNEAQIRAVITETRSDAELLELAIERNAAHGLQLSQDDKRDMAIRIYGATPVREREDKKQQLAAILSVSERTVRHWLSRTDKDEKARRNERILRMWMRCHTQEEIAQAEDIADPTVRDVLAETATLPKLRESAQASARHATDFDVPIYNVWKWKERAEQSTHYGNSDARIVDNLLYLYTEPFGEIGSRGFLFPLSCGDVASASPSVGRLR